MLLEIFTSIYYNGNQKNGCHSAILSRISPQNLRDLPIGLTVLHNPRRLHESRFENVLRTHANKQAVRGENITLLTELIIIIIIIVIIIIWK